MLGQNNPLLVQAARAAAERKRDNPKRTFVSLYKNNPTAFLYDCVNWREGEGPTPYQEDIVNHLVSDGRVCVRGPRGLGKTMLSSTIILWFAITRELECGLDGSDWKIPTTAGSWRQLVKFLWPEVKKWARRLNWSRIPMEPFDQRTELLNESLKLGHGEAFAMASDRPDLIEGAHADHILCVFDESKAISHLTFDAAEGIFHGSKIQEGLAVAVSTPGDMVGRFYDIQSRKPGYENWWVRHVRLDEVLDAGRITAAQVEQHRHQWGESSPMFQAQVLGEFPPQGEDTLINLNWVTTARQNELKPVGAKLAGCDIARFGGDSSVELIVQDGVQIVDGAEETIPAACIVGLEDWQGNDLMQTTGRIKNRGIRANVDSIGVGSGVVDRLLEQGFDCQAVNVSERADDPEHYANLRAELYWALRNDFRDGHIDLTRLTDDQYDRLCGELVQIHYEFKSNGTILIEAKEKMKARLNGRSPDFADALMLTRRHRDTSIGIHVLGEELSIAPQPVKDGGAPDTNGQVSSI